jgi:hypothetical protein
MPFNVKSKLRPEPTRKLHTYYQRLRYSFVVQTHVRFIKAITRDVISGGKSLGNMM